MPCFHPLSAWRAASVNSSGRRSLVFSRHLSDGGVSISIPCQRCGGCRDDRSRQWAIRCRHEASQYQDNCFITLTYDDAHLPKDGSLSVRDFQLFCKRLRKGLVAARGRGFRFYACGEYGDKNGRPHYHAILFDVDFHDRKRWRISEAGEPSYRSAAFERYWTLGQCEVGDCTYQSCAYVARYVDKKMYGPHVVDYYMGRVPEFSLMSKGIGKGWFKRFYTDVYPGDFVLSDYRMAKVPRYYDKMYEALDPVAYREVKLRRMGADKSFHDYLVASRMKEEDNTSARLAVKEEVRDSRRARLRRSL